MKPSAFAQSRDQRIADDAAEDAVVDKGRLCAANGCPNLWTAEPGRLCRWHAAADPSHWPQVTDEMQRHIADLALARANDRPAPCAPLGRQQKLELLAEMRAVDLAPERIGRDLTWAYRLMEREKRGESLSQYQREAWRGALGATPRVES